MGSQQLVANELLAFIQYAIDSFDEPTIIHICKSSSKEEEVCKSKTLLFQSVGKLDAMPSRRRDGGEKSVQDIITLLKETDPDDVPTFVAKQLDRIPPVSYEHIDCTRLLKDITFLKTSLAEVVAKLSTSEATISELRAEVVSLRNTMSVSRSPPTDTVNTRRGAQNASIGSLESTSFNVSPPAAVPSDAPRPAARTPAPARRPSAVGTSTPQCSYAVAASHEVKPNAASSVPSAKTGRADRDDGGFKKVEKKKRKPSNRNKCGTAPTGPSHLLRPEIPTTQLYISRVHYTITAEDVAEYIKLKTNMSLRVVKLESHYNVNFNSFVVRVPSKSLGTYMVEEFWPRGVKFRRFRGRIPDTMNERRTSS